MKIINAIILVLITTGQVLAAADDAGNDIQEYDVEIIIFEDAHARYINTESWNQASHTDAMVIASNNTQYEPAKNTNKLNNSSTQLYKNIAPAILNNEYKRINSSSEYKVLLYTAWRQTGLSEENAFDINIDQLENTHRTKSENAITGTLKVVLARYLHLYGQLEYIRNETVTINNNATNNTAGQTDGFGLKHEENQIAVNKFPIEIRRRMRSKELHYIDHPLVGILVQINPVDKTK